MNLSFLRVSFYLSLLLCLFVVNVPISQAAIDNNVQWEDVYHNTRVLTYRSPFGAIPTSTPITIRIRTKTMDLTALNLYVWNAHGGDVVLPMSWQENVICPSNGLLQCDLWVTTIPAGASTTPRILYYKFELIDGTDADWYVDDYAHNDYDHEDRYENGTGMMVEANDGSVFNNSFNITVYDATSYANYLDDWAYHATIYQIMPDRFRNGDPTNDQWVYNDVYGNPTTLHAVWHEAPEDARVTNQWSRDFFGGDLQGVMDELDYLEWLGVTAIYFNPIFNAPSNHGYDTTDYLNINPRYGDNALFQLFAQEAENRGIKVILDGVFNHTGSDSRYFDRYNRWDVDGNPFLGNDGSGACESASSPFADFYFFTAPPPVGPCYDGHDYESWWGYDTLPNLIDWIPNNAVRDYIFDVNNDGENGVNGGMAVVQYWYSLGADGWRFDVADEVPHDFWQQFRHQVKVNDGWHGPLYSEVWFEAQRWLFGSELDSTMNYRYRKAVLGFLIDSTWTDNDNNGDQTMWYLTPSEFDYVLNSIREDYPAPAWYAMMNLMGSHDTNRALFVLRERSADLATAIKKQRMMAALQFSYPGAPTIYYGDEAGLGARDYGGYANWGAGKTVGGIIQDDPYNRHPMVWEDDFYQFDSSNGALPPGLPNTDLQEYYRTLAVARRNYEVLRTGDVWTVTIRDDLQTYGYARFDTGTGECAIALFNRDLNNTRNITTNPDLPLPGVCTGTFYDILPDNGVDNATGWTVSGSSITVNGVLPLSSVLLLKPMDNPNTTPTVATFPINTMGFTSGTTHLPLSGSTPVTVTLDTLAGLPMVAGEQVNFAVVYGGGSVSSPTANTNSSGEATVTYNAPASPTTAMIQASITAHDGKVYRAVFTVQVGLGNGATVSHVGNTFATIGPERAGNSAVIPVQAIKYGRGEAPLSVSALTENPHTGATAAQVRSPFVRVNLGSTTNITAVEVRVKYTPSLDEALNRLWWWNGSSWQVVSGSVVDVGDSTVAVLITDTTTPNLSHLVSGADFVVDVATISQFFLDEQHLLHHLQTNATPSNWSYLLTDFMMPNTLRVYMVIDGEVGLADVSIAPQSSATIMRWEIVAITTTGGDTPSEAFINAVRQDLLIALAHAVDSFTISKFGSANFDMVDYAVSDSGIELEVVLTP